MFYATGPRQHWTATNGISPAPLGLISNIATALLLAYTTYKALLWTLSSFNAKLSIATPLGILSYFALLSAFEVADNAKYYEMFPRLRELFVETHVFECVEKAVWLTLFIACLWIPNYVSRLRLTRSKAANHDDAREWPIT